MYLLCLCARLDNYPLEHIRARAGEVPIHESDEVKYYI